MSKEEGKDLEESFLRRDELLDALKEAVRVTTVSIPIDEYTKLIKRAQELQIENNILRDMKYPQIKLTIVDDNGEIIERINSNLAPHEEETELEVRIRELVDNSVNKIRVGEENLRALNNTLGSRWINFHKYVNSELKKLPWIVRVFVSPANLTEIPATTEQEFAEKESKKYEQKQDH